jgi:hypothetical protein
MHTHITGLVICFSCSKEKSNSRQGYRSDASDSGSGFEGNKGDFNLSDTEAQGIRSAPVHNEVQDCALGPAASVRV